MDEPRFARRTLPTGIPGAYCKIWFKRENIMGLFSGFGLSPLFPVKGNVSAVACEDIFTQLAVQTLCQHFRTGPFLF